MPGSTQKLTVEEVWETIKETNLLLQKLSQSQKETDRQVKETALQLKETDRQVKETALQLKETDRQLKESKIGTDRQIKETGLQIKETGHQIEETGLQIKETGHQIEETGRQINEVSKENKKRTAKLEELFTGQWGKLMESLVRGDLIKLLNERNIEVEEISPDRKKSWNGQYYEFDIIAINGDEIVVVEVKTTLRSEDLENFMNKLRLFKKIYPLYSNLKVYGAVAYLKENEGMANRSEKKGLFVIRATGSSASIVNKENFRPQSF